MSDKSCKIALIGLGTVGTGVAKILLENGEYIYQKNGVRLELAHVVDNNLERPRAVL